MSRIRSVPAAALCVVALWAVIAPAPALATPASWASVDVRLIQAQDGTPVVLVGGDFPDGTKLPATGVLSVPSGIKPTWVGEILGGDPSKDPTAKYSVTPKQGFDAVTLTLTKVTKGQVEYADPAAVAKSGQESKATLRWTSPEAIPSAKLYIQLPQGATVTSPGDTKQESLGGQTFYSKAFTAVKAGQALEVNVTYTGGSPGGGTAPQAPGAPAPGAPIQGSSPSPIPVIAGGLLAAALIFFVFKQRRRALEAAGDEDAEMEEEPPTAKRGKASKHAEPEPDEDENTPFDVEE
ncbi:MAG: hypothetical protein HY876_10720 [Coriobacteriales bacterium]|nr:hypothetical protein [Coriobacteriales bacterium]